MKAIGNIQLIWRPGKGSRRISIGTIKKNETDGVRFQYNSLGIEQAKKLGFEHYEGFPDTGKVYSENVLQIFGQRLIKSERTDLKDFYDFWNIDVSKAKVKFYMLAFTQGLLPTDNFEFLADYNIVEGLHFLTEVAGLTDNPLASDALNTGDILRFENDSANPFDKEAVKIFKGDLFIGYIKKIHCKIFYKPGADKLMLSVKAIEKNGVIKKVFVKIAV